MPTKQGAEQTVTAHGHSTVLVQLPPEEKSGDRIGRYKLLEKLGEGGMGTVWRAAQTEPVRREVALKLIKTGAESNQVLARLEAERQALALMDHPNIARVFDAGATPAGRPFFVMELVKGIPITRFCDERQLTIRQRLELFLPVCHAVQHAHQKGVIHRDLKPSNILVTMFDDRFVPKVIDFGIAKATGQRLTERTLFTEFGAIVGTLEYMSPEQAELNQLDIDTRSDIYSLGVLLYELLTGTTPLTREGIRQGAFDEILRRIRQEEPPRPSTRLSQSKDRLASLSAQRRLDPDKLLKALSGDLDWIAMKALEKDRMRRYETANGLGGDVQRYLDNEPVLARPPSSLYRFQKLLRRHKVAFAAASAVLAALVGGLGAALWMFLQELEARQRADKEAALRKQLQDFMVQAIYRIGPSLGTNSDTAWLDTELERQRKQLRNQPELTVAMEGTIGQVFLALGQNSKAEEIQFHALDLGRTTLGDKSPVVATAASLLATTLFAERKLPEAEKLFQEALQMRRRSFGRQHPEIAESLNDLSLVLLDLNLFEKAEQLQREALAMDRKLFGNENSQVASSLNNLAQILTKEGKLAQAEDLQLQEIALSEKLAGKDAPEIEISLNNLALLLNDEKKYAEAERIARDVLTRRKQRWEHGHSDVVLSLNTLAKILSAQDKLTDSERILKEALEMQRSLPENDPGDLADELDDLASVYERQGKTLQSEPLRKEASALREKKKTQ